MTSFILNYFATRWKGPAVAVQVGGTTTTFGSGTPETTIHIKNPAVIRRLTMKPSLAFGEGYMRGDIEVEGNLMDVLQGFYLLMGDTRGTAISQITEMARRFTMTPVSPNAGVKNAEHHYNVGNDFYKLWLDPSLAYTCAYYANEDDDLETAQRQKFELVCRKARLQPGQKVVDLGCGWGGLMFHAVEHYDVHATGYVAAREQATYIEEEAKRRGLEDKITVHCADWRDATGTFDRVLSVGMLEHVGLKRYAQFFGLVKSLLSEKGIALVHTIGRMQPSAISDPWIDKYIFPGYFVPAPEEMAHYAAAAGLHITDLENLWQHYTKTLHHWAENYDKHREKIIEMYGEEFDRMWWLYLLGSEAAFKWGALNLWQIVVTKDKQVPWPLQREVGVGKKA